MIGSISLIDRFSNEKQFLPIPEFFSLLMKIKTYEKDKPFFIKTVKFKSQTLQLFKYQNYQTLKILNLFLASSIDLGFKFNFGLEDKTLST